MRCRAADRVERGGTRSSRLKLARHRPEWVVRRAAPSSAQLCHRPMLAPPPRADLGVPPEFLEAERSLGSGEDVEHADLLQVFMVTGERGPWLRLGVTTWWVRPQCRCDCHVRRRIDAAVTQVFCDELAGGDGGSVRPMTFAILLFDRRLERCWLLDRRSPGFAPSRSCPRKRRPAPTDPGGFDRTT